ncbi:MAG: hypothetical protein R3F61_21875 [Myxococcota bacterium]
MWLAVLSACTSPDPVDTDTDRVLPAEAMVVSLETRDGVTLVGDLVPGTAGAGGVVLLHMTPLGGWNRTDWPASFVEKLTGAGFTVLALDRRGAGDSGGVAEDAFDGPAGKYDVEAAVLELQRIGAGPLAIVGASNGTTSALDYAAWAGSEGLPEPVALGFMTGGAYTENQTAMSALTVPAVFTYSTAERAWSVDQQPLDPGSWSFLEYADGAHGTQMFAAAPEVEDDLETFLSDAL